MHEDGEDGLARHLTKTGTWEQGVAGNMEVKNNGYGNGSKQDSPV